MIIAVNADLTDGTMAGACLDRNPASETESLTVTHASPIKSVFSGQSWIRCSKSCIKIEDIQATSSANVNTVAIDKDLRDHEQDHSDCKYKSGQKYTNCLKKYVHCGFEYAGQHKKRPFRGQTLPMWTSFDSIVVDYQARVGWSSGQDYVMMVYYYGWIRYIMWMHLSGLPQGYPLYIKGDPKLLTHLKLTLCTTLSVPKPIQLTIPFLTKQKQQISTIPLLQPIICLQILDDIGRQQLLKGKCQLKPDTLYIYYPTQFRVDQKIYKALMKNFQALLDQLPRNMKNYLHRLILWEEGKGDHSIEMQKHRINECLSEIAKQLIQSKLASFTNDIKQYQSQPSTPKSLLHIFLLKNKLATLYSHLQLRDFAHDLFSDIWNHMMTNFRCLMNVPLSQNKTGSTIQKLDLPQDIPKLPYIFSNTNDILGYFDSPNSTAYLRIVTHAFVNYFEYCLALGTYSAGLAKLKFFVDFVLNNVLVLARRADWEKKDMGLFDLSRNLWAAEVVFKCIRDFEQILETTTTTKVTQQDQDTIKLRVSIMSMLRNSIQRIGLILYSFDNYSIFPTSIPLQINFVYNKLKKIKQPWHETKKSVESIGCEEMEEIVEKTSSLIRRELFVCRVPENGPNQLKLRELFSYTMAPSEEVIKLLVNFQAYSQVYLYVLQGMYQALKQSPFRKVARSLKLTLERATIMLGDWQDYQKVHNEAYQFGKEWAELHAIEQIYRLFFLLVKFLSNQLEDISVVVQQIVEILNNIRTFHGRSMNAEEEDEENGGKTQFSEEANLVLEIVNAVSEVLDASGIKISLSCAHSLTIFDVNTSSDKDKDHRKKFQMVIMNQDLMELLSLSTNWKLGTRQVMICEGEKMFELQNVQFQAYKKCQNCIKCQKTCLNKSQSWTKITGNICSDSTQYLFHIQSIHLQIPTKQSSILLQLDISSSISETLYKINSPVLQLKSQYQPVIFAEVWAPLQVGIANVGERVSILRVDARVRSNVEVEEYGQAAIRIGELFHFRDAKGETQEQYYQIGKKVEKQISCPHTLTFFLLNPCKPRNSKTLTSTLCPIQQTDLHIHIVITFSSLKTRKQFNLNIKTGNVIQMPLLEINYHVVQTCQEFQLTNLRNLQLVIEQHTGEDQQDQQDQQDQEDQENQQDGFVCQIGQGEVVCLEFRYLKLYLSQFPKMKNNIALNSWFDSQNLLAQKNKTFRLWYKQEHSYHTFQPISIMSEVIGEVSIIGQLDELGLEVIGKVKGKVQYVETESKCINLWIVPVRVGNIVLPELWIDGKRGIWVNSLVTNVSS